MSDTDVVQNFLRAFMREDYAQMASQTPDESTATYYRDHGKGMFDARTASGTGNGVRWECTHIELESVSSTGPATVVAVMQVQVSTVCIDEPDAEGRLRAHRKTQTTTYTDTLYVSNSKVTAVWDAKPQVTTERSSGDGQLVLLRRRDRRVTLAAGFQKGGQSWDAQDAVMLYAQHLPTAETHGTASQGEQRISIHNSRTNKEHERVQGLQAMEAVVVTQAELEHTRLVHQYTVYETRLFLRQEFDEDRIPVDVRIERLGVHEKWTKAPHGPPLEGDRREAALLTVSHGVGGDCAEMQAELRKAGLERVEGMPDYYFAQQLAHKICSHITVSPSRATARFFCRGSTMPCTFYFYSVRCAV